MTATHPAAAGHAAPERTLRRGAPSGPSVRARVLAIPHQPFHNRLGGPIQVGSVTADRAAGKDFPAAPIPPASIRDMA